MGNKIKGIIIVIVIGLVAVGIWFGASKLVSIGRSTKDIISEKTANNEEEVKKPKESKNYIETPEGTVPNQTGSIEDRSVQCVYEYFEEYLPELGLLDKEYEIRNVEDNNYCVNVGDWYVYTNNVGGISYPYKFTKSVDFTDEEREYLLKLDSSSSFVLEGDAYVWKVEE